MDNDGITNMLSQVLEGQRKLESRQDKIEEKLSSLQSEVQKFQQSSSSSPDSASPGGRKRKRVVTRALSVCVFPCWVLKKMDVNVGQGIFST